MKDVIYLALAGLAIYIIYVMSKTSTTATASQNQAAQTYQSNVIPVVGMALFPSLLKGLTSLFGGITTPNTNTSSIQLGMGSLADASTSSSDSTSYNGISPLVGNGTSVPSMTGIPYINMSDASTNDPLPQDNNDPVLDYFYAGQDDNSFDLSDSPGSYSFGGIGS